MTDRNRYQTLPRARVRSAIEQAKAASAFTHAGVKGAIREILIGNLFRPMLPSDIGVGTGQIIDSYGSAMSGQIDIVLYDKSILPPILIDEKIGIFPVEAVLYNIEVKTTLNATELSSAHEAAKKLDKFGYLPGLENESGKEINHPVEKLRSVVLALGSDLSGTNLTEAQRYKNLYGEEPAYVRAICIAGREYCYDNGEYWVGSQGGDEYDEILAFLAGVTNTYKKVSRSRHSPLLGNYVAPEPPSVTAIESRKVPKVKIVCQGCGKEAMPNVGNIDLVINGAINSSTPCTDCGATMSSNPGTYRFVRGRLVGETANVP